MILCFICTFVAVQHVLSQTVPEPTVTVTGGVIKGILQKQRVEPYIDYYAFKGVPYAAPPVGELRFKPPQPVQSWESVKVTQEFGKSCPQLSEGAIVGSEDCLSLNVFTRNLPSESSSLKPVMVWVHGGRYYTGEGATNGPDFLIEHDVVLVTINYRLNILGFLSIGDEPAYGNMGLKDQLAALRWVQDNIKQFNGDPDRVTIFGVSAGAMSAELLQISPLSKGLFHQVIGQSGSALTKRALQRNQTKYLEPLTKHFSTDISSPQSIVDGLRKIDYAELVAAANNYSVTGFDTYLDPEAFAPIIEENHPGAVITSSMYESLRDGNFNQMPFMFGFNTGEASFGFSRIEQFMDIKKFDTNPELFVSPSLNLEEGVVEVGKRIRDYFLGTSSATDYEKFSRFLTQELYARGVQKSVEFKRRYTDGYFYRFSYKGTHTTPYPGVGHGEEQQYIFYLTDNDSNLTEDDILTRKRVSKLWANFAKTGSPTPEADPLFNNVIWPTANKYEVGFLDIGKDLVPQKWPNETEYRFFDSIFTDFAVRPFVTY